MYKLICIIFIIASYCTCFAQKQEHLTFKGIPLEGSMDSFCQKLEAKGYIVLDRNNTLTVLHGDFTGYPATIRITATDDGKNVFAVCVIFDSSRDWRTLVNTYDHYKDLYTIKYGQPKLQKEHNPSNSNSNAVLMLKLEEGTVEYFCIWETKGGEIKLTIDKSSRSYEGQVSIYYRDSLNVKAKIQSDLNDI